MGYSSYALFKKLGFSPAACTAGVFVFLFNSFTISKINFLSALASYSYIPLIILTLLNYLESGRFYFVPLFGLLFSLSILAGHPPTVVYTVMLILAFAFYQFARGELRMDIKRAFSRFMPLFAGVIAAFILTLPQTGLFLELIGLSSRGAPFEYSMAADTSMSFMNMWAFLMPAGLNGFSTNFLNDWYSYSMGMMNFFSITALFLLLLSFFYPKNRLYKFTLTLVFLAVVISLGRNTPVHSWFFTFFPFFSMLRHPGFAMTLFTLPFSIISAHFGIFKKSQQGLFLPDGVACRGHRAHNNQPRAFYQDLQPDAPGSHKFCNRAFYFYSHPRHKLPFILREGTRVHTRRFLYFCPFIRPLF
jgi:hypothetical protein